MNEISNVFPLRQPGEIDDPLTEIAIFRPTPMAQAIKLESRSRS
jgi:hypothetical protein